jgi:hypothetical protein
MGRIRWPTYAALLAVKYASRSLWPARFEWIGEVPRDPWRDIRVIALLHHTSLAEAVYLSIVPNAVLRQFARHGVVPIARETMDRPIEGRIFRLLTANPVPITRRRDHSWASVMARVHDPQAMVTLFPEGRMMRPNGLDKTGEPMRVKAGIADVLQALGRGRMLIAYSGGLHHVFAPGASLPRLFQPLVLRLENVDISSYLEERARERPSLADAVIRDLTRRRDLFTPIAPGTPAAVTAEVVRRRHQAWLERTLPAGRFNGALPAGQPRRQTAGDPRARESHPGGPPDLHPEGLPGAGSRSARPA